MDYNLYGGVKSNRLMIVSDRAPEFTAAVKNALPGVFVVRYNYETSSLDDIICECAAVVGSNEAGENLRIFPPLF